MINEIIFDFKCIDPDLFGKCFTLTIILDYILQLSFYLDPLLSVFLNSFIHTLITLPLNVLQLVALSPQIQKILWSILDAIDSSSYVPP